MKDENTDHGKKFNFNEDVTSCFSDMLERSIPSYQTMRDLTFLIVSKYIGYNSKVLDIGTSTGDAIFELSKRFPDCNFVGLENSDPMMKEATERFKDNHRVTIKKHDLRNEIMEQYVDIIISSLTIQFTPIEYRLEIIKNLYDLLPKGGLFIFIEKVIGSSNHINKDFVDIYYKLKTNNGYSEEEIQRKKLALEGVLVPVTAKWNEELLKMSGFSQVDCFWRCLNFSGWVAIK